MSNAPQRTFSNDEIDDIVVAQADEDEAWEAPIHVFNAETTSVVLSSELTARAALLAKFYQAASLEDWINHIVRERVSFEEAALAGLRRELVSSNSR